VTLPRGYVGGPIAEQLARRFHDEDKRIVERLLRFVVQPDGAEMFEFRFAGPFRG
jgi:hypothetical protein